MVYARMGPMGFKAAEADKKTAPFLAEGAVEGEFKRTSNQKSNVTPPERP